MFQNRPRWLLDGSQMDQNMSKQINKSPEVLFKIAFDYLRSSPKSPRRLPTITNISIFTKTLKKNLMDTLSKSMNYSWVIHKYLWWFMYNPWISTNYSCRIHIYLWMIHECRYLWIIHGQTRDTCGFSIKYQMPSMWFSQLPPAVLPRTSYFQNRKSPKTRFRQVSLLKLF